MQDTVSLKDWIKERFPIKIIAIDLDDTLNNFAETLEKTTFTYDDSHGLTKETFDKYICELQNNATDKSDLLSNEYSYFRYKIHEQCYTLAQANADGVKFMQWLQANHWRIVICTYRDLRRASECTTKWLHDHQIPYDYLFTVKNKIVFCKLWNITHLIDDDPFNIYYGEQYGVNVYYSIMKKHENLPKTTARGFHAFDEVKQWIQE